MWMLKENAQKNDIAIILMNNTLKSTNLNVIYQFTNAYYLLIFLKIYKKSHFPIQNCHLKFVLRIKLTHLCAFKYEFGNLKFGLRIKLI